jgi:hypothetical protein
VKQVIKTIDQLRTEGLKSGLGWQIRQPDGSLIEGLETIFLTAVDCLETFISECDAAGLSPEERRGYKFRRVSLK